MTSRYRRAREMAGLSIGQAARLLDIRIVDVIAMENGSPMPSGPDISVQHVADVYGVAKPWLLGADPVLPPVARELLRSLESDSDRLKVEELLGAIYTEKDK